MSPAKLGHLVMAVVSEIGLLWLKARELVKEYPGVFLILLIVALAAGMWL